MKNIYEYGVMYTIAYYFRYILKINKHVILLDNAYESFHFWMDFEAEYEVRMLYTTTKQ